MNAVHRFRPFAALPFAGAFFAAAFFARAGADLP